MRHGHQRGQGAADSGRERQQESQHNGARGYQGSDYNSRGDTRGHGMREYHQPDYAQRDFSQRALDDRTFQHHELGPVDQRGQPVRDYGPTFGDGRGNRFTGGGHMDWSTGQDWHARSNDFAPASVQPQVSHRGKGPKGYKRSDDRIHEAVSEALHDDHYVDASDVTVEVSDGEVTLSGMVDDRRTKRMAEQLVEGLAGVHDVVNQLRVKRTNEGAREASTRAQTSDGNGTSGKHAS